MNRIFPLAFMANTFAMTILLIVAGLGGHLVMAAEIGVVQGAALALFYAFSANARSLILNNSTAISASSVLASRLLMMLPLSGACYWLSTRVGEIDQSLVLILILRRCAEWLGEVHLSEMERLDHCQFALHYFIVQAALLLISVIWLFADLPFPLLGLFFWAIAPLLLSAGFIASAAKVTMQPLIFAAQRMLPHLGSSLIIGVTVYIFRILILALAGKTLAGDLFTAFAIGGLTGSVFANALGVSMALHEQRIQKRYFPKAMRWFLQFSLLMGLSIFILALFKAPLLDLFGKSYFFWQAVGLSLMGGTLMVFAQRIRFRLLQGDSENNVLKPDILANLLIIASVPLAYFGVGQNFFCGLYLLSAGLSLLIYQYTWRSKNTIKA